RFLAREKNCPRERTACGKRRRGLDDVASIFSPREETFCLLTWEKNRPRAKTTRGKEVCNLFFFLVLLFFFVPFSPSIDRRRSISPSIDRRRLISPSINR
ncbi:hypothetical protein BHM03_00037644, partial [Ensete ventricosum]